MKTDQQIADELNAYLDKHPKAPRREKHSPCRWNAACDICHECGLRRRMWDLVTRCRRIGFHWQCNIVKVGA